MISASELEEGDEATIEQSPEHQAPTPSLSLVWVETGENTLLDEKTNNGNEIITPTEDLLPLDPVEVQPTLGNSVKDVPAEPAQTEMEEPGEANELVEDTAENTGKIKHENIYNSKGKHNISQMTPWVHIHSSGFDFTVSSEGTIICTVLQLSSVVSELADPTINGC